MDEQFPEISQEKQDYLASLSKAALSLVPFAGPFLAEIVGNIIPNQRFDRVCKYIQILRKKIENLEIMSSYDDIQKDKGLLILFEKSIRYSADTNSSSKYTYFSDFIITSYENKTVEQIQKEKILDLIAELNEIEIIHLIFYGLDITIGSHNKFIEENESILYPEPALIGQPEETAYPEYFKKQYLLTLVNKGLLRTELEIDRKTGFPVIDTSSRDFKIKGYNITDLGRLVFSFIGAEKYKNGD